MTAISKRYEFAYLFDVVNGNPNGDPDAGNLPRLDPETSRGLVTDVCLKRKVRNFVQMVKDGETGQNIYVRERAVLNNLNKGAYEAIGLQPQNKKLPKTEADARRITRWMCDSYFDIRTFGAVMSTEINCGQVRGPVQFSFAHSIDPIFPLEVSITRMAVTNEKDVDKERTMGRKHIVPYGLYRAHGYISAHLAQGETGTGFSDADLALFWQALAQMFDHDRSAARGEMTARGLIVFEHDNALGNAPAHKLFELVAVDRVDRSETAPPPRGFADYRVTVQDEDAPAGVTVRQMI